MKKAIKITGTSKNISEAVDKDISDKKNKSSEGPGLLKDLRIGISISDSPDLEKLGYSKMHLDDASTEFARYFLAHGATLIYGGDLSKDGFTYLFSEMARLYTTKEQRDDFRFKNYFAWPIHLKLNKFEELDFKQKKVDIEKLALPGSIKKKATIGLTQPN